MTKDTVKEVKFRFPPICPKCGNDGKGKTPFLDKGFVNNTVGARVGPVYRCLGCMHDFWPRARNTYNRVRMFSPDNPKGYVRYTQNRVDDDYGKP